MSFSIDNTALFNTLRFANLPIPSNTHSCEIESLLDLPIHHLPVHLVIAVLSGNSQRGHDPIADPTEAWLWVWFQTTHPTKWIIVYNCPSWLQQLFSQSRNHGVSRLKPTWWVWFRLGVLSQWAFLCWSNQDMDTLVEKICEALEVRETGGGWKWKYLEIKQKPSHIFIYWIGYYRCFTAWLLYWWSIV